MTRSIRFSCCIALAMLLAALAGPSRATTIHVPDDQPTIQIGIDAAAYGDTVLVACGTYYEHDIIMKSGVCLTSETGQADCVTIDVQELHHWGLSCEDVDDSAAVEGITIVRAAWTALRCLSSSLEVTNCTFADNADTASGALGGGVLCMDSGPTFTNCTFTENSGGWGGGMLCWSSSPTLTNCIFSHDFAGEGGGMMCIEGSSPTLTNCAFWSNGSASYWEDTGGGGLCSRQSSPTLIGCTFFGNWEDWWGHGGGIRCGESTLTLTNCIIAYNTGSEGGVSCDSLSSVTLACSDVFGNEDGDWVRCIEGQLGVDGNIWGDPLFCDAPQGDLTIAENSPCAPESNPECGLIGAFGVGCGPAPPPQIAVSQTFLNFGPVCIGGSSTRGILVSNEGAGWLAVSEISTDHDDFSVNPTSFILPPGDDRTVHVEFAPSSEGSIAGTLTISSDDPIYPELEIVLEGEGILPPEIVVSPDSLSADLTTGETQTEYLSIGNSGWSDLAWEIEPSPGWVGWLSFDPLYGVVPPGDSTVVAVTFDSGGLYGGDYFVDLVILSNDPYDSEHVVSAHLHVTSAPDIAVSDTLMVFGQSFIGWSVTRPLLVVNEGTAALTVMDVFSDNEDFSPDLTTFSLPPEGSQTVIVEFTPSAAGPVTGTLTITSDDPDEGTLEMALEGEGLVPPEIDISPESLSAALPAGQIETQFLTIENNGGSELVWSGRAVAEETGGRDARVADLTGVRILWDQAHGQDPSHHSTVLAQLIDRGATVTQNQDPISGWLLSEYDILWTTDCSDT